MSVYGNIMLKDLAPEGSQINPASIDLPISNKVILVTFDGYKDLAIIKAPNPVSPYELMFVDGREHEPVIRYTEVDLDEYPNGIWVRPGIGVLCSTPRIEMPYDAVGQVLLKSSRGREFYQSCMAGYVDNSFHGDITLELYAPVIPIFLQTGMKIVQLRIDELKGQDFGYDTQPTAKYYGQTGPTGSKDAAYAK